MMKNLIVVLLCLVHSFTAHAGETSCTSVNIPIAQMGKIRNQGVAGLCFAYAAADLVSWAIGWRISAIDIALYDFQLSHHPKMTDVYHNGGDEIAAINYGAEAGYCPESESPSDEPFVDFSEDPHAPIFDAFAQLDQRNWRTFDALSAARKIFPQITASDLAEVSSYAYPKRRILELRRRNCPGRKAVPGFRMRMNTSASGAEFVRMIDRELSGGKIVGIAFHSNSIYSIPDKEDGHVVPIVARRWNEARGSCEYMIRDTFGEQCDVYKSEIECHGGYIWVNDELLRKNVFEVDTIRRMSGKL